jgi:hypothetical protein
MKTHSTVFYSELAYTGIVPKRQMTLGLSDNSRQPSKRSFISLLSTVLKVGQYPALSVSIPKALEKNLGKDAAALYRKALISRNQGFGVGAVTYIRRVVEDKPDELLEVVAQNAETLNVDTNTVAKIRQTRRPKIAMRKS